jgi:lipid II:glycine glycyltransferase (peptidoglycan interpeptide bridge formation enzyme)
MTALFVQPPDGAEDVAADLLSHGFRRSAAGIAPGASLRLDLTVGADQLRKGLDSRVRSWTNRWSARGVTVREGDDQDIAILAGLIADSADHQGYTPLTEAYLLDYYRQLAPEGLVALFVGEISGSPVAARLYTICGNVLKARLAGMDRSGSASRLSVPAAVEWNAILWAKARGLGWFDCGGVRQSTAERLLSGDSVTPSEVTGSDWFKTRFGGRPVVYPQALELIRSPILRRGYDWVLRSPRAHDAQQVLRRLVRGGTSRPGR